jgi:ubiquinone/menaquinone biosynthesis C-methylase UbiE
VAADVGAGDGRFSVAMAADVGAEGRVIATEVDPAEIAKIRTRLEEEGVRNVEVVSGDQHQTGLPPGCCDAILLRLVYHHFTDPAAMRKNLWAAMKPGARLAIIDVPPKKSWRKLEGVPERGGHGIVSKELVADLTSDGFEVVSRDDRWPGEEESYCVVFRRPR